MLFLLFCVWSSVIFISFEIPYWMNLWLGFYLLLLLKESVCILIFLWCFYFVLQVLLSVDVVNSYIAWDFSLVQGKINMVSLLCCYTLICNCYNIFRRHPSILIFLFICQDIGFSLEFVSPTGEKTVSLDGISLLLSVSYSL